MRRRPTLKNRDYEIQALVDGGLAPDAEKRVRAQIDSDPMARARYEMLLAQKRLLVLWYQTTVLLH